MTFMLAKIKVQDYESWKPKFDQARDTVRSEATGHRILRSVESPDELFIQVEFPSAQEANAARERLMASGMPDGVTIQTGPSVAEVEELVTY